MEIMDGIEIKGLALLIEKEILVISDIHVGVEEQIRSEGIIVPINQFRDVFLGIKELMKLKPRIVVINGDLKQEFGKISNQEWRDTLKIIDLISQNCGKTILIKGNHDKTLGPIARKRNIEIVEKYFYKDIVFVHGDKEINVEDAKTIIIGHVHPSLVLRERGRIERYKCFMKGRYKNKNLIVMPAFSLIKNGMDILSQEFKSPYVKNLRSFDIFAVGDKVYPFGKVKDISGAQ